MRRLTMDDDRYWPFSVLPPEKRTPLHQQQIDFLETAYREGFRPHTFGSDNFGATARERGGWSMQGLGPDGCFV